MSSSVKAYGIPVQIVIKDMALILHMDNWR